MDNPEDKDTSPEEKEDTKTAEDDAKEDSLIQDKSDDDIRNDIIDKHGLDPENDRDAILIDDLVAEAKESRRTLSTAIKQKRKWRDAAQKPAEEAKDSGKEPKEKPKEDEVDINELIEESSESPVLLPCEASGLEHPNRVGYLDDTPPITPEEAQRLSLLGCSLSARIFKAVYGVEPRLVNMCPVDLISGMDLDGPVLTKCCKVKEGYELKGDTAIVPWGARTADVAAALEAMMAQMSS